MTLFLTFQDGGISELTSRSGAVAVATFPSNSRLWNAVR
ncbi:hypothetical protein ACVWZK_007182 [Bradyrhizobium sp. GM0.4]